MLTSPAIGFLQSQGVIDFQLQRRAKRYQFHQAFTGVEAMLMKRSDSDLGRLLDNGEHQHPALWQAGGSALMDYDDLSRLEAWCVMRVKPVEFDGFSFW